MQCNKAIARAHLGDTLSVSVACGVTTAALAFTSWWAVLMGIVVSVGVVVWGISRERIRRGAPRIPSAATFDNTTIRCAMEAIAEAQDERMRVLRACRARTRATLDGVVRTAVDVEVGAIELARRTDRLHRYLAGKDMGSVRAGLGAAQLSARSAKTACERDNYESAAKAYEIEAQTLGSMEMALRIALARLENMRAALTAVPPEIVRWQTTGADLSGSTYTRLSAELRNATGELEEAHQQLHMLSQTGPSNELGIDGLRIAQADVGLRVEIPPDSMSAITERGEHVAAALRSA